MNIRVFAAVALFAALISAQDLTLGPDVGFSEYEQTNTWFALAVTNNMAVSATSVTFTCYAGTGNAVSYIGSAPHATVGTISASSTGYGSFAILASAPGDYPLTFTVSYKKSGVAKVLNGTLELYVSEMEKKRDVIPAQVEAEVETVSSVVEQRSDLSDRDAYLSIVTDSVYAYAGEATWSSLTLSVASIQCNNISFMVTPISSGVAIAYAFPDGNYIGTGPANSNPVGNFQHLADCGYYNLNVSVSYKLQGTSTTRRVWKIVLLSVIGDGCEGGDTVGKRAAMIRADLEGASANGMNRVPIEYAVAVGIAGVALVAVFSVVGTMFFIKRRNQETTSA